MSKAVVNPLKKNLEKDRDFFYFSPILLPICTTDSDDSFHFSRRQCHPALHQGTQLCSPHCLSEGERSPIFLGTGGAVENNSERRASLIIEENADQNCAVRVLCVRGPDI